MREVPSRVVEDGTRPATGDAERGSSRPIVAPAASLGIVPALPQIILGPDPPLFSTKIDR